ncbi:MAG: hydantoinase/oxoprolinase family protein [Rudaea sp.]|uniref:hydantoinase/oxoprolinase family protein n=1 Tax=Rudaea sp. TaxID=2136325 RepID=UPI0039E4537B
MGMLVSVDNGGTLTDFCVVTDDAVHHAKTLTTPYDLSKCFFEGLQKVSGVVYGKPDVGRLLADAEYIRYSTTVGTNALVERKGPRIGVLTTTKTDVSRLTDKEHLASLFEGLVGERVRSVDSATTDATAFETAVIKAVNELANIGAARLVIAVDGADFKSTEARIKDIVQRKFPSHLLGALPMLSAGDLTDDPQFGRRTWTAILNSFLHPAMERFLYSADYRLKQQNTANPLLIFRNDGGSARVAKTTAVKTYSSGPRGGMEGTRALAAHYNLPKIVSYDVGGTTTDIGIVENGVIRASRNGKCEGVEVAFPLADVISSGVGGSSIIGVADGKITVGPKSVGALPGPACFGRGGEEATITDVFLLEGLLDKNSFFGGDFVLDESRSKACIEAKICGPLKRSLDDALRDMEAAWVGKIAHSITDFAGNCGDAVLAGFGGAGALAATAIADSVGAKRVLIPRLAAVFSAYGINFSNVSQEYRVALPAATADAIKKAYGDVLVRARRDMYAEKALLEDCQTTAALVRERDGNAEEFALDAKTFALPCDVKNGDVVSLQVRTVKPVRCARIHSAASAKKQKAKSSGVRNVLMANGKRVDVPVYKVEALPPGAAAEGPAIIEEAYFTGKVDAGWSFEITAGDDILLTRIG